MFIAAFVIPQSEIKSNAAKPIINKLTSKGGQLVLPPEGFYVEGMEGPLLEGELDRAVKWADEIQQLTS